MARLTILSCILIALLLAAWQLRRPLRISRRETWQWRAMLLLSLVLLVLPLLSGCGSMSTAEAREYAAAHGCWPYGVEQPMPRPTQPATATPLIWPTADPRIPTATAGPSATPVPPPPPTYVACTPAPATPTLTPSPTPEPPTIPAHTAVPPNAAPSQQLEIGDPAGMVNPKGLRWAYNPATEGHVVAYISYAWTPTPHEDGVIWLRAQDKSGAWHPAISVNTEPVTQSYGGLGLAVLPDGTIVVAWSKGDPDGAQSLWTATSTDGGQSFAMPEPLGFDGGVFDLLADGDGGLHLLLSAEKVWYGPLRYGYRAPGASGWQWSDIDGGLYVGDLAVLPTGSGLRRFVVAASDKPGHTLKLYRSDDGVSWDAISFQYDRHLPESNPTIRPTIIAVPRADGLVAFAWSSYGAGGVFAGVSLDGGLTFSPAEIVALHDDSGAIGKEWDYGILPGLAYDAASDQLAASWVEVETDAGEVFPYPTRTLLAVRPLDDRAAAQEAAAGTPWQYAVTPEQREQAPQIAGTMAFLDGTPDGQHHSLLELHERNTQFRVELRTLQLVSLISQGDS